MFSDNRKILCVILHYGDEETTWECVASLADEKWVDILVADNDPEQKLEVPDRFSDRAAIFKTGGIAGFAQANNMAVRAGRSQGHVAVLVLNNDTLVQAGAIDKMMQLLCRDGVGIVGPCMPYADRPETIWACGGVIDKFRLKLRGLKVKMADEPYDVDYLPGAAILASLEAWDLAGGLPERYFLAYEEAEFAMRVRASNLRVMVHPGALILHKVGMSSEKQPMYFYNRVRNRLRFGRTVWGKYFGFLLAGAWCLVSSRRSLKNLILWAHALRDEMTGVPLDRASLQWIKQRYGS